jgi:hypothetical protein
LQTIDKVNLDKWLKENINYFNKEIVLTFNFAMRSVALREPVAIEIIGLLRKSIDQKDHLKVMSLKLNKPLLSSFLYLIL